MHNINITPYIFVFTLYASFYFFRHLKAAHEKELEKMVFEHSQIVNSLQAENEKMRHGKDNEILLLKNDVGLIINKI